MPEIPKLNLPKPETPDYQSNRGHYGIDEYMIKKIKARNAARKGIKKNDTAASN
jgi:hypothetical protein